MEHVTGSYDFVVVGAGTAGCVLAARLSEDGAARVLLLEAGSQQPLELMPVPPAWPSLLGTSADWADTTVVQAATGAAMPWPRGRALGGSSAINGMNFVRGHRSSYDAWAEAGATGWGFDDLLPYFRRSERATGRDPAVRGDGGPLAVGPASPGHPVAAAGLAAAAQAGYPRAADISAGLEEGFGWCDLNIADGRRQSARDAYLTPALSRGNLDVVTGALAHRVRLDGDRCTGVDYSVGTSVYFVRCTGEVVLAAGTVGSAQLLLSSGIGPQSHLRSVGIDVAADLPGVGGNLFDHPMSGVVYRSARPVPAGQNNHGEALGLIRSDPGADMPDLQVMFVDVPLRAGTLPGPDIGEGYTLATSLMLPASRGSVRLAGAEPGTPPLIDPNYYADPRDLETFAAGLRAAREIGRAAALDEWRGEEVLPGPDVNDDASLRAYLRRNLQTYSHPGGTCRIGTDAEAVVDADLRVHGISGLRVADASVMPSAPSANTNATVYAIAERAADLLRARPWRGPASALALRRTGKPPGMESNMESPHLDYTAELLRHFADLRDGTHGGAISRPDKESFFAAAVPLLDPYARQSLREINTDLLLGTGEVTATGIRRRGGGVEAIWALSWPEQEAAGISPIIIRAHYGAGAHHPHLQGGTVGDWPLNVFDEGQAAAELPVLRAVASADLHNLVFQRDYRIIPAIVSGWVPQHLSLGRPEAAPRAFSRSQHVRLSRVAAQPVEPHEVGTGQEHLFRAAEGGRGYLRLQRPFMRFELTDGEPLRSADRPDPGRDVEDHERQLPVGLDPARGGQVGEHRVAARPQRSVWQTGDLRTRFVQASPSKGLFNPCPGRLACGSL